jgi:hypothetical protein
MIRTYRGIHRNDRLALDRVPVVSWPATYFSDPERRSTRSSADATTTQQGLGDRPGQVLLAIGLVMERVEDATRRR